MLSQSHDEQSKTPAFNHTDLSSVITEVALGLKAQYKEQHVASGTAVLIGKYLAITARHVIEDFWQKFETQPLSGSLRGNFHLNAFQLYNEGKTGALWSVRQIWPDRVTDIAFLHIVPASKTAAHFRWRYPRIDLIPPAVGTRIAAFGYHTPAIRKTGGKHIEWVVNPYTSIGEVKLIHHEQRDTFRMPFPCFQTNARYDGGMSGGPVFTDTGHLCGLICSNLPPDKDELEQEHVSYVASLWPSMGVEITIDREGFPKNTAYPVLDLARDGFITALGWERIQLVRNENGVVTQVRLNQ